MKDVTLKLWDSSPQSTDNFSLITKFTDLGEPTSRKSILGFYINYFLVISLQQELLIHFLLILNINLHIELI